MTVRQIISGAMRDHHRYTRDPRTSRPIAAQGWKSGRLFAAILVAMGLFSLVFSLWLKLMHTDAIVVAVPIGMALFYGFAGIAYWRLIGRRMAEFEIALAEYLEQIRGAAEALEKDLA
jgi:Flp pilus assembly protein TadB